MNLKTDVDAPLVLVQDVAVHFLTRIDMQARVPNIVKAVDGVTLHIRRQETLGLVGESGSGKSTLARAILGLVNLTAGEVVFDGQRTASLSKDARRQLCRRMQIVFQDPYASLDPRQRVLDAIVEPMMVHGVCRNRAEAEFRAHALASRVGLAAEALAGRPRHLSGGQRQRAVIARALALGPEFVILDEPTSFLDVSVQARILQLLKDLQCDLGLTYLFISHNLDLVAFMSDRVAVMYCGKIVEISPASVIFDRPLHPYTEVLVNSVLPPEPDQARQKQLPRLASRTATHGCHYYPVCPRGEKRCTDAEPPLLFLPSGRAVACFLAQGYEEVRIRGAGTRESALGTYPPDPRLRATDARGPGR